MTPNRRVTWQATSDDENSSPRYSAARLRGRSRRARSSRRCRWLGFSARWHLHRANMYSMPSAVALRKAAGSKARTYDWYPGSQKGMTSASQRPRNSAGQGCSNWDRGARITLYPAHGPCWGRTVASRRVCYQHGRCRALRPLKSSVRIFAETHRDSGVTSERHARPFLLIH